MFSSDIAVSAIQAAMAGQSARLNAIADNMANIGTPGYTAKTVSFEAELRSALQSGRPLSQVTPTVGASTGPPRHNGNNVYLDVETALAVETVMARNLLTRAMNGNYAAIRSAISMH